MENRNNDKRKILIVIAIFIALIILSVGGVYAYFAARATNSGSEITGRTLDINGSTLTISASRVTMNPTTTPVSDDLVPAVLGASPTEITTTEVNRALTKQCSLGGYTGCHVWKITATSTTDIPGANIKLNLSLTNVQDKNQWSYVVYTGTDSTSSTIINKGNITTTFPNTNRTLDIHNGAALTANTPEIYYVMVYLNNINLAQNDGVTDNTTNETGTYNGTVILEAMGGEVKVNFYEPEPTDVAFFNYEADNGEVKIYGYKEAIATYTVSDQSACENYLINKGLKSVLATTLCSGDDSNGFTLGDLIVDEDIPSSDYTAAGLSNVVITPAPTDVVIPSTIDGYPVTVIDAGAFQNMGLTSVEIPSSVTSIGEDAFSDNSLTSITIGNDSVSIGDCAFGINPPLDEPFLSNYSCQQIPVIDPGCQGEICY